jgi:hypothetical protein
VLRLNKRVNYCFPKSAFGVVILGHNDTTRCSACCGGKRRSIDGLVRVTFDNSSVDAFLSQSVSSSETRVQSDAGANEGDVVTLTGTKHFRAAYRETFAVRVENRICAASRAQVTDALLLAMALTSATVLVASLG